MPNDKMSGRPWRFGYEYSVDLGLETAGVWDELPNGDGIWRINFVSEGAKTLNFVFDRYDCLQEPKCICTVMIVPAFGRLY